MNVSSVCVKATALLLASPLYSPLVLAAESTKPVTGPDPLASAGKVALFLVLVLGLILLLAWLAQRVRNQGGLVSLQQGTSQQPIRILATQSVGIKERIAVIQVGEQQLLVGITPQQINLLTELQEPLPGRATETPASFAALLKKAVSK